MLNTQQPGDGGSRMGFPDWLTRVCGRSRATAEAYARDTAAYMDWAAGQGLTAAQALSVLSNFAGRMEQPLRHLL